jgi:hypothetical protein
VHRLATCAGKLGGRVHRVEKRSSLVVCVTVVCLQGVVCVAKGQWVWAYRWYKAVVVVVGGGGGGGFQ